MKCDTLSAEKQYIEIMAKHGMESQAKQQVLERLHRWVSRTTCYWEISQLMDIHDGKMIDEKIEVLAMLCDGKEPREIKGFYKVLEPMDPNTCYV